MHRGRSRASADGRFHERERQHGAIADIRGQLPDMLLRVRRPCRARCPDWTEMRLNELPEHAHWAGPPFKAATENPGKPAQTAVFPTRARGLPVLQWIHCFEDHRMAQPKPLLLPGQRQHGPSFGTDQQQLCLTDVFGARFEGAVIMRDVSLNSEDIRKLVRRDYLFLSKMLHTIKLTRDYRTVEPGPLNRIEADVQAKIKSIRELIGLRRIELQKRFNKHPDATIDVTHARTTTFAAPVASPHANAYLDLLLEADEYIARATAGWLQGLLGSQEFHGACREIKRSLHSVKADVTRARAMCFKLLERASAQLAPSDPEAAQLKADVAQLATGLLADARNDSEVMDALPVSDGHDLEVAVNAATSSDSGGDAAPAKPAAPGVSVSGSAAAAGPEEAALADAPAA